MKAVRMYKPKDIRVEDVPIPVPTDDEVLLKVMVCGVCGSDIPRVNVYGAHIAPLTIGHEFSARVEEVGKNIKNFKAGDRVTVPPLMPCYKCEWCKKGVYSLCEQYDYFGSRRDGAMAEYVCAPEANLMKLPDNVDYIDAATTDPCANAIHGLRQAGVHEGDVICIYGTGPIGLFAIQCAKAFGVKTIIAVDLGERKLAIAKECGADYVIDSLKQDAVKEIERITDGEMVNIALDFTGAPIAQVNAINSVGKMGKVVLVGISHKGIELGEKEVDNIMRGQISLIGSWNSFTKPFPGYDWTESLKLFQSGKITSKPMISHKLSLEEAPEIFRKIAQGKMFFNKILFLPNGENFE
ncbi:MAG: galactitol-1-phosphate 5-dehydrogenase [Christensenella sp.]